MPTFTHYIIREPYNGTIESLLLSDGTVAYTNGQTLAEYEAERGFKPCLLSERGLTALDAAYEQTLVTPRQSITEEQFDDALNVLPPCRWHNAGSWNVFHVSERLRGNLVSWYASRAGTFYTFIDVSSLSDADIARKLS